MIAVVVLIFNGTEQIGAGLLGVERRGVAMLSIAAIGRGGCCGKCKVPL